MTNRWFITQVRLGQIIELYVKYSKLGVLGPSLSPTGDQAKSQDENSTTTGRKEGTQKRDQTDFLTSIWSPHEFHPHHQFWICPPLHLHCSYFFIR